MRSHAYHPITYSGLNTALSPRFIWETEVSEEFSSPRDVIDPRIDVFAQRALLRLSKNPNTAADASGILAAVKGGQLGGIYKEDQRVPALLARRKGKGWWKLLPRGENARLDADTANPATLPIIVFRNTVRSNPARLDPALIRAFRQFQVSPILSDQISRVAPQLGLNLSTSEIRTLAIGQPVSFASRRAEFQRARDRAKSLSGSISMQGEVAGTRRCGRCPWDCQCECVFLFRLPFFGNPVCFCFGAPKFPNIHFCTVF